MTYSLTLYSRLMGALHGFVPGILNGRAANGKEDPARLNERLGQAGVPRPQGNLVWFHGVSVGESLSALPVIDRLRQERPDLCVLITTATTTSAEILAKRLPQGVIHHFAPVDTPQAVRAFLDHWRPDLAVFIESDIWPVLLSDLTARAVPHVLLSARITEKTARGWRLFPASVRHLLLGYALILAQDVASENRLRAAGARPGPRANLKILGAPLPVKEDALSSLRVDTAERRVILAASTHYGEDSIIAKTLESRLREGDLLILVPRHPIKAGEIRLDLEAMGLNVARRSYDEPLTSEVQVYLADTLGDLGLFFSVADLVIMGGSFLSAIGGHNPLEAARLGKAVITGPDISNWQGIFDDLLQAGAAFRVLGPQELGFMLDQLIAHPQAVADADQAASLVSQREAGTLDVVWQAMAPFLPRGA